MSYDITDLERARQEEEEHYWLEYRWGQDDERAAELAHAIAMMRFGNLCCHTVHGAT